MSGKEDQGDASDDAYLSLTKLTREQVGAVSWLEQGSGREKERTHVVLL